MIEHEPTSSWGSFELVLLPFGNWPSLALKSQREWTRGFEETSCEILLYHSSTRITMLIFNHFNFIMIHSKNILYFICNKISFSKSMVLCRFLILMIFEYIYYQDSMGSTVQLGVEALPQNGDKMTRGGGGEEIIVVLKPRIHWCDRGNAFYLRRSRAPRKKKLKRPSLARSTFISPPEDTFRVRNCRISPSSDDYVTCKSSHGVFPRNIGCCILYLWTKDVICKRAFVRSAATNTEQDWFIHRRQDER